MIWEHVRSHDHEPFNEFADSIVYSAASNPTFPRAPPSKLSILTSDGDRSFTHLHLLNVSSNLCYAYPPVCADARSVVAAVGSDFINTSKTVKVLSAEVIARRLDYNPLITNNGSSSLSGDTSFQNDPSLRSFCRNDSVALLGTS